MTPLSRVLRNVAERVAGIFSEGPNAPPRFAEVVAEFARTRPRATRAEWAAMAGRLASEAYKAGYVRGYEWAERDLDRRDPEIDPSLSAELEGHGWSWAPVGPDGSPPDDVLGEEVPDDGPPLGEEIAAEAADANSYFVADCACDVPPDGWRCSRPKGHVPPCAATRTG